MVNIFEFLKNDNIYNEGKMYVYVGQETETDPTEHTVEITYNNPIPIKVLMKDASLSALKWHYSGQLKIGSKEIICSKNCENLLKICRRIVINEEDYAVYKDAQGFGILKRKDYLIVILEKR